VVQKLETRGCQAGPGQMPKEVAAGEPGRCGARRRIQRERFPGLEFLADRPESSRRRSNRRRLTVQCDEARSSGSDNGEKIASRRDGNHQREVILVPSWRNACRRLELERLRAGDRLCPGIGAPGIAVHVASHSIVRRRGSPAPRPDGLSPKRKIRCSL